MTDNQRPDGTVSVDDLIAMIGRKEIQIQLLTAERGRMQKELAAVKAQLTVKDNKQPPKATK